MQKEATISDNQLYRYKLSRTWDSTNLRFFLLV